MKGNRATPRPRNARTDSTTAGLTSGRVRLSGAPQLKLMSVCMHNHARLGHPHKQINANGANWHGARCWVTRVT